LGTQKKFAIENQRTGHSCTVYAKRVLRTVTRSTMPAEERLRVL